MFSSWHDCTLSLPFPFIGVYDILLVIILSESQCRLPQWRSGLRHCRAVLAGPLEMLGASPGSVAASHDRKTHGAVHNWPSVVWVRGGFGRQGCTQLARKHLRNNIEAGQDNIFNESRTCCYSHRFPTLNTIYMQHSTISKI